MPFEKRRNEMKDKDGIPGFPQYAVQPSEPPPQVKVATTYARPFSALLPTGPRQKTINFAPGLTKLEAFALEIFSRDGNKSIGVALAVAYASELLDECARAQREMEKQNDESESNNEADPE